MNSLTDRKSRGKHSLMRQHSKRELSRRDVVRLSVGGGCGIALLGLSESGNGDRPKLPPPAPATTLERRVISGSRRVSHLPYRKLANGPAQEILVRDELCSRDSTDNSRRIGLAAFGHLTDAHVLDATNPGRLSFLWQYFDFAEGFPVSGRFRPQDLLTVHVLDATVRKFNAIGRGPLNQRPLDCLVSTGDLTNTHTLGELSAAIGVFRGEPATSHPAGDYEGVQNYGPAPLELSESIWHPEPEAFSVLPDSWKSLHGYPTVPGFLAAAIQPVMAEGASCPWYTGFGNHDESGRATSGPISPKTEFILDLRRGDRLPLGLPPGMNESDFWNAIRSADATARRKLIASMPSRAVGASPLRRAFSKAEFIDALPENPRLAGNGSGADQSSTAEPYFTFDISPDVVGIMLNTASPDGSSAASIDVAQAAWLEKQLRGVSRTALDSKGRQTASDVKDRLVVLFSHHPLVSFAKQERQPDGDVQSLSRESVHRIISRFPNVILWMNGHRHKHRVTAHRRPQRKSGFWEITTSSLIDYPQQSRVVEIMDNADGTLSIATTLLDHSEPESVVYSGPQTPASLAALSLELAMNHPGLDRRVAMGGIEDGNVDLLLDKPF